jgi:glycine cleavage system H lipoate-binding protein
MDGALPLDLFATKGVEYLIVIVFLSALTVSWRLFRPVVSPAVLRQARSEEWKAILRSARAPAADVMFHPGHAWARLATGEGTAVVGWDDFARRLIGPPEEIRLPKPGTRIRAGEPAWSIGTGGRAIPMLAPVDGEVEAVNEAVLRDPTLASRDPYGEGWLMRVRVPAPEPLRRNLLGGRLAQSWSELAERALQGIAVDAPDPALGAVMADGGEPRAGLARTLAPDRWEEVVNRLLLIDPVDEAAEVTTEGGA